MINCTVRIFKDEDVLDHGHKVSETSAPLWEGPAYLASPDRSWEQQLALEGVLTGQLHVHTHVNLNAATRVAVATHALTGEYQVLGAALTSNEWRLALGRRPHHASSS